MRTILLTVLCCGLLRQVGAQDILELSNGDKHTCEIIHYESDTFVVRLQDGSMRKLGAKHVTRIRFATGHAAAQPAPAQPAVAQADAAQEDDTAIRIIESNEINRRDDKGYLILTYTFENDEDPVFIEMEQRYATQRKIGHFTSRDTDKKTMLETLFDRTGQMIIEVDPGSYSLESFHKKTALKRKIKRYTNIRVEAGKTETVECNR